MKSVRPIFGTKRPLRSLTTALIETTSTEERNVEGAACVAGWAASVACAIAEPVPGNSDMTTNPPTAARRALITGGSFPKNLPSA